MCEIHLITEIQNCTITTSSIGNKTLLLFFNIIIIIIRLECFLFLV